MICRLVSSGFGWIEAFVSLLRVGWCPGPLFRFEGAVTVFPFSNGSAFGWVVVGRVFCCGFLVTGFLWLVCVFFEIFLASMSVVKNFFKLRSANGGCLGA